MIRHRIFSGLFIFLYLVFLGNANLYANTSVTEVVSSCCSESENSCCGLCSAEEESPNEDNICCKGNGCCGWQETRVPSSVFHSENSKELRNEEVQQEKLAYKFNSENFYTLNFYFVPVAKFKLNFYPKRNTVFDRQSNFSIWRC